MDEKNQPSESANSIIYIILIGIGLFLYKSHLEAKRIKQEEIDSFLDSLDSRYSTMAYLCPNAPMNLNGATLYYCGKGDKSGKF